MISDQLEMDHRCALGWRFPQGCSAQPRAAHYTTTHTHALTPKQGRIECYRHFGMGKRSSILHPLILSLSHLLLTLFIFINRSPFSRVTLKPQSDMPINTTFIENYETRPTCPLSRSPLPRLHSRRHEGGGLSPYLGGITPV